MSNFLIIKIVKQMKKFLSIAIRHNNDDENINTDAPDENETTGSESAESRGYFM